MAKELKVYLDRHIPRDNLLYKPISEKIVHDNSKERPSTLQLSELLGGEDSKDDLLRKPDFQRATAAWTPEECVSLLSSVLAEQVIPSIIMWRSPENHWYVLDGGHRLSVILAWLRDDWGENLASEDYMDEELEKSYKLAAKEVKKLLIKAGIKTFKEYQKAYKDYRQNQPMYSHENLAGFPFGLDSEASKMIEFYRAIKGNALPLQWVTGDYNKAKESFLNINKSGRKLTDWERKLVEHRDSSFARTVTSVANTSTAAQCWPSKNSPMNTLSLREDVENILYEVIRLHSLLFEPIYDPKFTRVQQPLLVESRTEPDTKAAYLAEFLTVVKGHTGRDAQTEKLLKQDLSASETDLVAHGLLLIRESTRVCEHLIGPSSQPLSLSIAPTLYFYSDSGQHIRSLLYGFIYWLFYENDTHSTFERKILFTAHRKAFEAILLKKKQGYVSAFGRKIGSGSEVTVKMAKYYNNLLSLLIKYQDNTGEKGFTQEYDEFLGGRSDVERSSGGRQRTFSKQQKSLIARQTWLNNLPTCAICGGLLDLALGTQYDHIQEHSKGGITLAENGRPTHPFCNNNRLKIEHVKNGQEVIALPTFVDSEVERTNDYKQLSFLTDLDHGAYDSLLTSMSDSLQQ